MHWKLKLLNFLVDSVLICHDLVDVICWGEGKKLSRLLLPPHTNARAHGNFMGVVLPQQRQFKFRFKMTPSWGSFQLPIFTPNLALK